MGQGEGSPEEVARIWNDAAETVEVEPGRKSQGGAAPDVHVDHSITRRGGRVGGRVKFCVR